MDIYPKQIQDHIIIVKSKPEFEERIYDTLLNVPNATIYWGAGSNKTTPQYNTLSEAITLNNNTEYTFEIIYSSECSDFDVITKFDSGIYAGKLLRILENDSVILDTNAQFNIHNSTNQTPHAITATDNKTLNAAFKAYSDSEQYKAGQQFTLSEQDTSTISKTSNDLALLLDQPRWAGEVIILVFDPGATHKKMFP